MVKSHRFGRNRKRDGTGNRRARRQDASGRRHPADLCPICVWEVRVQEWTGSKRGSNLYITGDPSHKSSLVHDDFYIIPRPLCTVYCAMLYIVAKRVHNGYATDNNYFQNVLIAYIFRLPLSSKYDRWPPESVKLCSRLLRPFTTALQKGDVFFIFLHYDLNYK